MFAAGMTQAEAVVVAAAITVLGGGIAFIAGQVIRILGDRADRRAAAFGRLWSALDRAVVLQRRPRVWRLFETDSIQVSLSANAMVAVLSPRERRVIWTWLGTRVQDFADARTSLERVAILADVSAVTHAWELKRGPARKHVRGELERLRAIGHKMLSAEL